jgi:hypothetical protein
MDDHVGSSGSGDEDSDAKQRAAGGKKDEDSSDSPAKRTLTFDKWHRCGAFGDSSQRSGYIKDATFTCRPCRAVIKVGNKLSNFTKSHLESPS